MDPAHEVPSLPHGRRRVARYKAHLTTRTVADPSPRDRRYIVWDDELLGFDAAAFCVTSCFLNKGRINTIKFLNRCIHQSTLSRIELTIVPLNYPIGSDFNREGCHRTDRCTGHRPNSKGAYTNKCSGSGENDEDRGSGTATVEFARAGQSRGKLIIRRHHRYTRHADREWRKPPSAR